MGASSSRLCLKGSCAAADRQHRHFSPNISQCQGPPLCCCVITLRGGNLWPHLSADAALSQWGHKVHWRRNLVTGQFLKKKKSNLSYLTL